MARVCVDWFPIGSRKYQKEPGFYMDDNLKCQLDILLKNIVNDWDFTIIISGGGEVRVGKSVLEMQIMAYWAYQIEKVYGIKVPFSIDENLIFQWEKLIEQGNLIGQKSKYCPMGYDEAGETMEGTKAMSRELKAVRDYLRECGQYNFLNVLVLPEFFDLPKGIALTRSILFIDVFYVTSEDGLFQRGYFKFYSRKHKKQLYLKGKKELNYKAHPYNFQGKFNNFYPFDEQEYREKKMEALRKRETNKKDSTKEARDLAWALLYHKFGMPQDEIGKLTLKHCGFKPSSGNMSDVISKFEISES